MGADLEHLGLIRLFYLPKVVDLGRLRWFVVVGYSYCYKMFFLIVENM